jgi:3-phytase
MNRFLVAVLAALVVTPSAWAAEQVRFTTFNASLNRAAEGQLVEHLSDPTADTVFVRQAKNVAEVIQRVRPDVLLINEFDFAPEAVDLFRDNFLEVSQNDAAPIEYPYAHIATSNTGIHSGFDLNNFGGIVSTPGAPGYGDDAFGFGAFPGQFGMVVYSKYPIDADGVRTFQFFKWKDMPGNLIPTPFYSPEEVAILRLSSKSHWDVPISVGGKTVHFLVSHPTPPVFDGPEDRNGRRNHDEIRFWADYILPSRSWYVYDDAGVRGGLRPGSQFVIAGDQNSDPLDGDSIPGAIQQLLEHPLVNTRVTPSSAGAVEAAELQGGANTTHRSDPRFDTADFNDAAPGNLRADYVLPRKSLEIVGSGVFWPLQADPLFRLTGVFSSALWGPVGGFPTSDHRAVWVDVIVPDE